MKNINKKNLNQTNRKIYILLGFCISILVINVIVLVLIRSQIKTIGLLRQQLSTLKQDEQIIKSANEISRTYADEVEVISSVFPDETTIPDFIFDLESLFQQTTTQYNLKFTSLTPLKEGEFLYLPLSITLMADTQQLLNLLQQLEKLPYMTHITSISAKVPSGFGGVSEISLGVKVYVKNPFSAK